MHVFFIRCITAFLCLGALDSTLAFTIVDDFQQQNHKTAMKAHTKKACHYIAMKGYLFTVWNKNAECRLVQPQLGTWASGDSNFAPLWACPHMAVKASWVLTVGLEMSFRGEARPQIQNLWVMKIDCSCMLFKFLFLFRVVSGGSRGKQVK